MSCSFLCHIPLRDAMLSLNLKFKSSAFLAVDFGREISVVNTSLDSEAISDLWKCLIHAVGSTQWHICRPVCHLLILGYNRTSLTNLPFVSPKRKLKLYFEVSLSLYLWEKVSFHNPSLSAYVKRTRACSVSHRKCDCAREVGEEVHACMVQWEGSMVEASPNTQR